MVLLVLLPPAPPAPPLLVLLPPAPPLPAPPSPPPVVVAEPPLVAVVVLACDESVLLLVCELVATLLFAPSVLGPPEFWSVLDSVALPSTLSVGAPPAVVPDCATSLPAPLLSPQAVIDSNEPPIRGITRVSGDKR